MTWTDEQIQKAAIAAEAAWYGVRQCSQESSWQDAARAALESVSPSAFFYDPIDMQKAYEGRWDGSVNENGKPINSLSDAHMAIKIIGPDGRVWKDVSRDEAHVRIINHAKAYMNLQEASKRLTGRIVHQPVCRRVSYRIPYRGWAAPYEVHETRVADYTGGSRPAFRVNGKCGNCGWSIVARFRSGTDLQNPVVCTVCDVEAFWANGGFVAQDVKTMEEERRDVDADVFKLNRDSYKAWEESEAKRPKSPTPFTPPIWKDDEVVTESKKAKKKRWYQ